jgi:hypothetical protein
MRQRVVYQRRIYRVDMQANPDVYYLFGDNEMRVGVGGQAKEMRGEPNAIGIRTKAKPLFAPDVYWHDATLIRNKKLIDEDFEVAYTKSLLGHLLVVPLDGIGTGYALLPQNAPLTLKYIQGWIKYLETLE